MSFAATDLFSLGSDFSPQTSNTRGDGGQRAVVLAADGDMACESAAFDVITEYTAEYSHCGSSNGVTTDLNAVTTAPTGGPLAKFGCVMATALLTDIELSFSNNDFPSIRLTGHIHAANNHAGTDERQFNIGGICPNQQGLGISFLPFDNSGANEVSIAATSTVAEIVYSASLTHMESVGASGNHFRGQNRTCIVTIRLSGIGVQGDVTLGSNWISEDNEDADSNQDDDTFNLTAHQYIDAI